jgi:hypothetical protein
VLLAPLIASAATVPVASAQFELYRLDVDAASATRVGAFGSLGGQQILELEGLAYSARGDLYAVSDVFKSVFRINPATGAATFVAALDVAGEFDNGFAFTCDGRAFMTSDTTKRLYEVDVASGVTQLVAELPVRVSGLAARGNVLYGIGVSGDEGIYRIDPDSGATTPLGGFTAPQRVVDAGLDFDASGRLWATFDYNPATNGEQYAHTDLAEFDPTTFALKSVRRITGPAAYTDLEGMALAPTSCADGPDRGPVASSIPVDAPPALAVLSVLCVLTGLLALGRRAA